ncbi:MAG TPA: hypothetical protein PLY73_05225 [Candidatus Ozemobacteraceae bacterium]|nr:hypothetical protein [Candidatus Ozemobacteraceae bacterium]
MGLHQFEIPAPFFAEALDLSGEGFGVRVGPAFLVEFALEAFGGSRAAGEGGLEFPASRFEAGDAFQEV